MKLTVAGLGLLLMGVFAFQSVVAQDTFEFDDLTSGQTRVFTNSLGTAWESGGMIVFEGQLESTLNITSAYDSATGSNLASLKLLLQVKLFDVLPDAEDVGTVQGALAALRDAPESSTGKYYVWGITNSAPVGWVPLLHTNGTTFAVTENSTNYVTFVFAYPTDESPVTYRAFIGSVLGEDPQPTQSVVSPTDETDGINSVTLAGSGSLQEVYSVSGSPTPLSTGMGLSAYASGNKIVVEISTVNENGTGEIKILALINGIWVQVASVTPNGEGSNTYTAEATGLTVGQSYQFKVLDEEGNTFSSPGPVEVKAIRMTAVEMTLDTMTVQFNTEVGLMYQVWVAGLLADAPDTWQAQAVSYQTAQGWSAYVSTPFTAGTTQTRVRIPLNKARAFFKIIKVD